MAQQAGRYLATGHQSGKSGERELKPGSQDGQRIGKDRYDGRHTDKVRGVRRATASPGGGIAGEQERCANRRRRSTDQDHVDGDQRGGRHVALNVRNDESEHETGRRREHPDV